MSTGARIKGYGSAGALVLAGTVCAIAIGGELVQVLAFVLIALGLVAVTSLVFLEVGLSEDRQRARDQRRAENAPLAKARRGRPPLGRERAHRRRLH